MSFVRRFLHFFWPNDYIPDFLVDLIQGVPVRAISFIWEESDPSCLVVPPRSGWLWVCTCVDVYLATNDCRATYRLDPLHTARASFILPARDIRAFQLPLLSQVALVARRRRRLLFLCRSQEVVDHPDANRHRFHDALDVVYRSGIDG